MWNNASIVLLLLCQMLLFQGTIAGNGHRSKTQTSNNTTARNASSTQLLDEHRLYLRLRENYNQFTRPVYNASDKVVVSVGITLTQVFDLDEKNQILTTDVWLDQEWKDQKMHWDPADYKGLKQFRMPSDYIWKPDIVLYNSEDVYLNGYMKALVWVSNDSSIFWSPIVKFKSTCLLDITFFPFDDQVCHLKLGSWAYDGLQVDITSRSTGVDLSNYVPSGEWLLLKTETVRKVTYYSCCPEPYPDIRIILYMRRRIQYYVMNVIIPCLMLSVLTLLVFWLSPESGEKINFGVTVLLAFSVFMLMIAENIPHTSTSVPVIGIYLTSVMSITSTSVLMATVVSYISHLESDKSKSMHPAFRSAVIFLARLVCYRLHAIKLDVKQDETVTKVDPTQPEIVCTGMSNNMSNDANFGEKSALMLENVLNLLNVETKASLQIAGVGSWEQPATSNLSTMAVQGTGSQHGWKDDVGQEASRAQMGRMTCDSDMKEILCSLRQMLIQGEEKERKKEGARKWREAAEVIDCFLFWVAFMITLVSLVIIPLNKKALDGSKFLKD